MKSGLGRYLVSPGAKALAALLLVLLLGFIFNAEGAFLKWETHRDLFRQVSVLGILACGMTLVIVTGGIDLSVGSLVGLAAVLASILTIRLGWPGLLALPACLLAGAACGAASGALVVRFRVQPFIATLAMMVFARGLAKFVAGGRKISRSVLLPDGNYRYAELTGLFRVLEAKILWGNLALVTLVFLACALVTWVVLARLRWGRYLYAIGGNEEASRLSGVPIGAMKLLAYGLAGAFAALAGVCHAAQAHQGDPEAGVAYELSAIAMVVIGGTSLSGGRGGMGLTLLGVLVIGYLDKILSINIVPEAWRLMLTGVIIVGAVLFQSGGRRT